MRIKVREIRPTDLFNRVRFAISRLIYPACDRSVVFTAPVHNQADARVSVTVSMVPEDLPKMFAASELIEALVYTKFRTLGDRTSQRLYSQAAWNREHASVHVNLGRRMGHSTAARKIYEHFVRMGKRVCICVPGYRMARQYLSRGYKAIQVVILDDRNALDQIGILNDQIVIVDCAFGFSEEVKDIMIGIGRPLMYIWLE